MQRAASCRWATPTMWLSAPLWFDAEACPWACERDTPPRALASTEVCATCPHWESRPESRRGAGPDHQAVGRVICLPTLGDWFGAFPQPDEVTRSQETDYERERIPDATR